MLLGSAVDFRPDYVRCTDRLAPIDEEGNGIHQTSFYIWKSNHIELCAESYISWKMPIRDANIKSVFGV